MGGGGGGGGGEKTKKKFMQGKMSEKKFMQGKRRKARLIEQLGTIYISNISEGTAFLLQGVTKNDSKS